MTSTFEFLSNETGVVAAEPEGVVGDGVDLHFARLVGNVVQVAVGVGGIVVDGWRHDVGLERLAADGHLHRAGGPEHMAGGTFCGADGEAASVVPEDGLDGLCLADVALRRGGAVGVDVGNVFEVEAAGGQRGPPWRVRRLRRRAQGRSCGGRRRCCRSRRSRSKSVRRASWRARGSPARRCRSLRP